ncbi:LysR substrate-binding domain-containing protein [Azospirillum sp. B4]|uniref:LysR substrate-binding domain-containing protein n=1 Tax=Azospirillum sp. B4 TaxID=95605 RepID=UPI00034A4E61|nr:LysR substrate-binding domain-containing protein [Azospirillum sp. B4]
MPTLPSIQTLRALDSAATHGSYSAAADELGLTHGAISHRIRELEERLGIPLFRRVGRGMAPTREAVTIIAHVRQALAILERAFPDRRHADGGRLVISIHPALATRWLLPRLRGFTRIMPQVSVEIRSTADLEEFLVPGIDLAIRYGAGDWPNSVSQRLGGEVLFPVCSPEYRDRLGLETPEDLARCTILRHGWQSWSAWLRVAGLRLQEPTAGLTLSDSSMLIEVASSGQGVALAGSLMVQEEISRGRLVRLFDVQAEDIYGYYLVWQAGTALSASALAFRSWVTDCFNDTQAEIAAPVGGEAIDRP